MPVPRQILRLDHVPRYPLLDDAGLDWVADHNSLTGVAAKVHYSVLSESLTESRFVRGKSLRQNPCKETLRSPKVISRVSQRYRNLSANPLHVGASPELVGVYLSSSEYLVIMRLSFC